MIPSRPAIAAVLVLSSGTAFGQGYDRTDVIRGLCSKDGCDEFVILDKQPAAHGPDGELFRTRVGTYQASSRGRVERGEEIGFVYCSASRPAIINAPAGQAPVAIFLAPESQEPSYVQRTTTNFYTLYFALCHGIEAGKAAARDRRGAARSLGYQVSRQKAETVTLRRVEDVLAGAR